MTFAQFLTLTMGLLSLSTIANAQTVKVDQQNRTIEISAESSIQVVADRVTITVGYRNYGPTHDEAFADNSRVADRILKSWKSAGIVEKNISTNNLSSGATSESQWKELAPAERKHRQYEVFQSWKISEAPDTAEKLLDIAVDAGANEVGAPEWALADSNATESEAYASALLRAHIIADQMAKSFGGKVGALLYASNEERRMGFAGGTAGGLAGGILGRTDKSRPETKLLPPKIEKTGYVRAIFALE
jgi:uncharacterized protein YggE